MESVQNLKPLKLKICDLKLLENFYNKKMDVTLLLHLTEIYALTLNIISNRDQATKMMQTPFNRNH